MPLTGNVRNRWLHRQKLGSWCGGWGRWRNSSWGWSLFATPWTAACHSLHAVLHYLPELAQTHVHRVGDAIQPSHLLSSPSPAFNLSQHQRLSFPVSHLFLSCGQSTGASASASVLPVNIQDWCPVGLTGLISLQSKGLSRDFLKSKCELFSPLFLLTGMQSWGLESMQLHWTTSKKSHTEDDGAVTWRMPDILDLHSNPEQFTLASFTSERNRQSSHLSPYRSVGKEFACSVGDPGFDPWVGKTPWGRKWQPTPVSLPGKSPGQRSLVGCSPWGHKESDTTEQLTLTYLLIVLFP